MTTIQNNTRPALPNKAYDSEYATQFRKEYLYLQSRGFEPSFVKKVGEYRVRTYKYTKTPELFRAVADFYENHRNEKQFNELKVAVDVCKLTASVMEIAPEALQAGV